MFTLIVENENHEAIELTNNDKYDVVKIEGLSPAPATITTAAISNFDGARLNNAQIEQRNIVLYLNIKPPIEDNRQELYKYFRVRRKCTLRFKNANRDVYIDGYVETFETDLFDMVQQPQISIICPDPFFKSTVESAIEFSNTTALFEFPFSIAEAGIPFSEVQNLTTKYINVGDVETGAIFKFVAGANEILNPKIYNRTTQKYFGLNVDMNEGDVITINTSQGEKSATLLREGTTTNLLNKRARGSNWLQLIPGTNEISYDADEGADNLTVTVSLIEKYEGV